MRWTALLLILINFCILCSSPALSRDASPFEFCQRRATDDWLRQIPESLVPAAVQLFHLNAMPADQIRRSTYFRCLDRQVLICTVGANLPCGKANTSRRLPGADAWCADHADADSVPMYATGHETIYRWRCHGMKAAVVDKTYDTDRRGFIEQFWERVDQSNE